MKKPFLIGIFGPASNEDCGGPLIIELQADTEESALATHNRIIEVIETAKGDWLGMLDKHLRALNA